MNYYLIFIISFSSEDGMDEIENVDGDEHMVKGELSNLTSGDKSFETITFGCHSGFFASSSDTFCI